MVWLEVLVLKATGVLKLIDHVMLELGTDPLIDKSCAMLPTHEGANELLGVV